MKPLIAAAGLSLLLAVPAYAANTQQNRMSECNKQASGKQGDERKAFMSTCLSGKAPAAKASPQQRMKECNQQAQGKKGAERKTFMSSCLKG